MLSVKVRPMKSLSGSFCSPAKRHGSDEFGVWTKEKRRRALMDSPSILLNTPTTSDAASSSSSPNGNRTFMQEMMSEQLPIDISSSDDEE